MSNKDKHAASGKKSKKKHLDQRSAEKHGTLTSITEHSEESENLALEHNEDSEDNRETEENELDLVTVIQQLNEDLRSEMKQISNRVSNLEAVRNLNKDPNFHSPNPGGNKTRDRETKRRSRQGLLDSVAKSTVKQDWRTLAKSYLDSEDPSDQEKESKETKEDTRDHGDDDGDDPGSSSSSSDSDSSNSSESRSKRNKRGKKNKKNKKDKKDKRDNNGSPRRTSNSIGQVFKNLDACEEHARQTIVSVTRTVKDCNVKIDTFKLGKICTAMKEIMEYQQKENTLVNMSKVLSHACQKHLQVMYNITSSDLNTMRLSELFSIMAQDTKVHSKVQFYAELKSAMGNYKLMEWDKVNPFNHEQYYFQQLTLVRDFMMILKFMLEQNKIYCPAINDKENGLIRLFRSYHSYDYWKFMWAGMTQKYRRMQDFMEEYSDKAMEQYKLAKALMEIPYQKGSRSTDREKQYYDKRREINKSLDSKYPRYRDNRSGRPNELNHVQAYHRNSQSDDSDSDDSTWRNANPVAVKSDKSSRDEELEVSNSEDSLSEASNEHEHEDKDEKMVDTMLAAFTDHKEAKADKKDYPCLRKILSGRCELDGCPYGHRREILVKGANDLKLKLSSYITAQGDTSKEPSGPPYKVLQKEKYGKH